MFTILVELDEIRAEIRLEVGLLVIVANERFAKPDGKDRTAQCVEYGYEKELGTDVP